MAAEKLPVGHGAYTTDRSCTGRCAVSRSFRFLGVFEPTSIAKTATRYVAMCGAECYNNTVALERWLGMAGAVAYFRVSTEEQACSGAGLGAQAAACEAAAERLGLVLRATHCDAGISGSAPVDRRPGLIAALKDLGAGDVLLVAKRDRLGRDVILVAMIERLAERRKAKIISAAGEGTEQDDPSGQLMRRIVDAFSEYERALIRSRTKAALKAKRARGERAGSVPFGFDADAGGRLQPVTEEQSALSLMLQLRGDGLSYRGIAAELEKRGIAPKRGSRCHPSSVRSILLTAGAAA